MRRLVLVAMMISLAQGALAADMPDLPVLRGFISETPVRTNWEGWYVGGQVGHGWADMNFTNITQGLTSQLLANLTMENEFRVSQWPLMGKISNAGTGFGGFVGYNAQWDDAIIGVEANYLHGKFGGSDSGTMSRSFTTSDHYTNSVTSTSTASVNIRDMGTIRVRGGYTWNNFMPYIFGGAALGLADISKTTRVSGFQSNPSATPPFDYIPFDLSARSIQNNHFIFGYTAGVGMEVLLFGGVFARGEWEYVKFTSEANTTINTIRGGLGYKF